MKKKKPASREPMPTKTDYAFALMQCHQVIFNVTDLPRAEGLLRVEAVCAAFNYLWDIRQKLKFRGERKESRKRTRRR